MSRVVEEHTPVGGPGLRVGGVTRELACLQRPEAAAVHILHLEIHVGELEQRREVDGHVLAGLECDGRGSS